MASLLKRRPQCEKCKRSFKNDRGLVAHWINTGPKSGHFFCGHCMKIFPDQDLASRHWVNMHRPKQELGCPGCERVFASLGDFIFHLERDECKVITRQLWEEMRANFMAFAMELQRRDDDDASGPGMASAVVPGVESESELSRLRPTIRMKDYRQDHVLLRFEKVAADSYKADRRLIDPATRYIKKLDVYCCPLMSCSEQFVSVAQFVDHLGSHATFKAEKFVPTRVECPSCKVWCSSLTGLALHVEAVGSMNCFVNDSSYLGVLVAQLSAGLVDAQGNDETLKLSIRKDAFSNFMAKRQAKQAGLLSALPIEEEEDESVDAMGSAVGQFHFSEKTDEELADAREP